MSNLNVYVLALASLTFCLFWLNGIRQSLVTTKIVTENVEIKALPSGTPIRALLPTPHIEMPNTIVLSSPADLPTETLPEPSPIASAPIIVCPTPLLTPATIIETSPEPTVSNAPLRPIRLIQPEVKTSVTSVLTPPVSLPLTPIKQTFPPTPDPWDDDPPQLSGAPV